MTFDYKTLAREVGLSIDDLQQLERYEEWEYPGDPMMQELRLTRTLRSVRDGYTTIDEVLEGVRSALVSKR